MAGDGNVIPRQNFLAGEKILFDIPKNCGLPQGKFWAVISNKKETDIGYAYDIFIYDPGIQLPLEDNKRRIYYLDNEYEVCMMYKREHTTN